MCGSLPLLPGSSQQVLNRRSRPLLPHALPRLEATRYVLATTEEAEIEVEEDAVRGWEGGQRRIFRTLMDTGQDPIGASSAWGPASPGSGRRCSARQCSAPLPCCCAPPPPQMDKMDKTVESVRRNFGTVRTGRANVSMLDRIEVRLAAGGAAEGG